MKHTVTALANGDFSVKIDNLEKLAVDTSPVKKSVNDIKAELQEEIIQRILKFSEAAQKIARDSAVENTTQVYTTSLHLMEDSYNRDLFGVIHP